MSRRSHRHGPAHARPHRPEGTHQAAPGPRAAPVVPVVEPGLHEAPAPARSESVEAPDQAGGTSPLSAAPAIEAAVIETVPTETVVADIVVAPNGTGIAAVTPDSAPGSLPVAAMDSAAAATTVIGGDAQQAGQADEGPVRTTTCTTAQLRRFIKSRAYMPMHELRRRFLINGSEDDVTRVEIDGGAVFVGLPEREGRMLGDLLRGGEVGYELSHDPVSPIVVGVFPMRPIPRA
jgi:hypothetical protein